MNRTLHLTGVALAAIVIIVGGLYALISTAKPEVTEAGTVQFNLSGYAWANTDPNGTNPPQTGVGWISFDCSDGGSSGGNICSGSNGNYDVKISNDSKLQLTGYAWAGGDTDAYGNKTPIGWIQFSNNGSGCPGKDSRNTLSNKCDAQVIRNDANSGWELTGWARACSVFQSGCSGALKSSTELGGWDGWVSLNCRNTGSSCSTSGPNYDYAVRINANGSIPSASNHNGSFAWGDTNFGWINFTQALVKYTGGTCTYKSANKCTDLVTSQPYEKTIWCTTINFTPIDCSATNQICQASDGSCVNNVPTLASWSVTPEVVRKGDTVTVTWNANNVVNGCEVKAGSFDDTSAIASGSGSGSTQFQPNVQTTVKLICDGTTLATKTVQVVASVKEN